jgi:hypothetical protein
MSDDGIRESQPDADDSRRRWLASRQLTYSQRIIVGGAHSHAEWQANVDDVRRDEVADRIRQAVVAGLLSSENAGVLLDRVAADEDPETLERDVSAAGVPAVYTASEAPLTVADHKINGLAIAALVCAFVLAPAGIVLGHVALAQIKKTGEGGRPLAMTGLALGYIFTIVIVVFVVVMVVLAVIWGNYLTHCAQTTCVM